MEKRLRVQQVIPRFTILLALVEGIVGHLDYRRWPVDLRSVVRLFIETKGLLGSLSLQAVVRKIVVELRRRHHTMTIDCSEEL